MNTLRYVFLLIAFFATTFLAAQDLAAYQLFSGTTGKPATFRQVLKAAKKANVVFFGEQHNDPIAHWLQLELLQGLHQLHGEGVALAMEMFETDQNAVLQEYLQGLIRQKDLENTLDLWSNYPTDYQPMVEYARENQLMVLGTNLPRRYANLVYRESLEALQQLAPEMQQALLPPLPWSIQMETRAYEEMEKLFGENSSHGGSGMVEAQAAKDYVMAWNIAQLIAEYSTVLHINGSFHSDYHSGIVDQLKPLIPELNILTISTVQQKNLQKLELDHTGKADFILVTPANMTRTY